uniref:Uncharacterized protein n=1 Tax=Romanomermis culicivorax TaxID=13658 RepID=A0A915L0Z0_ROMCU
EDLNDHFSVELKEIDKIFDCFRSKLTIYNEASASKVLKIMDPSSENRMKILSNIRHRKAERAKKRVPLCYQKLALSMNTESPTNHGVKNSEEASVQSSSRTGVKNHNCDMEQDSPMPEILDKIQSRPVINA